MKKFKRTAATITALILASGSGFGILPENILTESEISIVSADNSLYEGLFYIVDDNDNITITGYSTEDIGTELVIPDEIDGKPVTVIGNYAFLNCSSVESVKIGNNVKSIGECAFALCSSLKTFDMGRNVTSVGDCFFASSYGSTSQFSCAKSTPMKISTLILPDNLKGIGNSIFGTCSLYRTSVENIEIKKTVTNVPDVFFQNGNAVLKSITVEEGNDNYSSDCGILYNADKTELIRCPEVQNISSYTIPDTVQTIDSDAFYCSNLSEIKVGDGARTIGSKAFALCSNLKKLDLGRNVTTIGDLAIASSYGSTSQFSCITSSKGTTNLSELIIPDNLRAIGNDIFGTCSLYITSVQTLTVPETVENISSTLYNKPTLKMINVDKGNEEYSSENGILYDAEKTTLIRCPQSTESKVIEIPDTVETICDSAFYYCNNVSNISVGTGTTKIGSYAFALCTNLKIIDLGRNVKEIGDCALASSYGSISQFSCSTDGDNVMTLSEVTIPDNVEKYGKDILGTCSNYLTQITTLVLPKTVTSIDNCLYSSALTEFKAAKGEAYTSLDGVLYNSSMTDLIVCPKSSDKLFLEIPEGVTNIRNNAFYGGNIQDIVLPASLTTIGENAFKDSKLQVIEGYTGSYAEQYAAENSIKFKALKKKAPAVTTEAAVTTAETTAPETTAATTKATAAVTTAATSRIVAMSFCEPRSCPPNLSS